MARHYEFDDYFIPGTQVLANKLGITEWAHLNAFDRLLSDARRQEIARGEVDMPRTFDVPHFQAVHHHLFQDLYEWAGELRTANMSKGDTLFAGAQGGIQANLAEAQQVADTFNWTTPTRDNFLHQAALFQTAANTGHPFREGNGRTTKIVMDHLAEGSPFRIEWDRVESSTWNMANARVMNVEPFAAGVYTELLPVLDRMVVDRTDPTTEAVAGPTVAQLLAFARSQGAPAAHQPDPLRYEQLPDLGQSTGLGRDQGLER